MVDVLAQIVTDRGATRNLPANVPPPVTAPSARSRWSERTGPSAPLPAPRPSRHLPGRFVIGWRRTPRADRSSDHWAPRVARRSNPRCLLRPPASIRPSVGAAWGLSVPTGRHEPPPWLAGGRTVRGSWHTRTRAGAPLRSQSTASIKIRFVRRILPEVRLPGSSKAPRQRSAGAHALFGALVHAAESFIEKRALDECPLSRKSLAMRGIGGREQSEQQRRFRRLGLYPPRARWHGDLTPGLDFGRERSREHHTALGMGVEVAACARQPLASRDHPIPGVQHTRDLAESRDALELAAGARDVREGHPLSRVQVRHEAERWNQTIEVGRPSARSFTVTEEPQPWRGGCSMQLSYPP